MKLLYSIGLLFLGLHPLFAQSMESRQDSLEQQVGLLVNKVDSVSSKLHGPLDSLQQLPIPKLNSLVSKASPVQKLDSLTRVLNRQIDSLRNLQLPYDKYVKLVDSLNRLNPLNKAERAQSKLAEAQAGLQRKLEKPVTAVNEKLNQLSQEAGGQGNLPDSVAVPGLGQEALGEALPGTNLPVPFLENPLGNEIPDRIGNAGLELNQFNPLKEINVPGAGALGEVAAVGSQVKGYTQEAKEISSGNMEQATIIQKEVAAKLPGQKETLVFEEQKKALAEIESVRTALRDKEAFKKQTLAKAKEVAAQQLAARHAQIQETVGKISTYQRRAGSIFGKVKGLPKQRSEKEKQVPLIERLVPGLTFQVQRTDLWIVDLNPFLRFRIRSLLSIGAGWNQRFVADKSGAFKPELRMYGIRGFSEVSILQGFTARVEVERVNAYVPISRQNADVGERKWIWGYMAGIKKEFTFLPKLSGNVQVMYNLYDPRQTSPYFKRLNVRFGVELPVKKQK